MKFAPALLAVLSAVAVFSYAPQAIAYENLTSWTSGIDTTTEDPSSVNITGTSATLTGNAWISATVANVISFKWQFETPDYLPFNDYAYLTLSSGSSTLSSVASVGDYGSSGWNTYSFATPYSGTITFGVSNYRDLGMNSTLSVSSVTAVPEPEAYAMLLAGLGIMSAVMRRRKNK